MEYKKVKRVGNNQAGFTFEVEVLTDTAEMTNGANFQNAEQVQTAVNQVKGLVIETETTTTVKGFAVPVLTAEQVVAIYNAVASGKTVTITDPSGNYHFVVDQADNVSDEISVEYKFFNTMYVTYTLVNDTVTVTGELIGKKYLHYVTFSLASGGSQRLTVPFITPDSSAYTDASQQGLVQYVYDNFASHKFTWCTPMISTSSSMTDTKYYTTTIRAPSRTATRLQIDYYTQTPTRRADLTTGTVTTTYTRELKDRNSLYITGDDVVEL